MSTSTLALLALGILVVAFLYSSVGHGGASGYIAVMALFGLGQAFIKPTALALNILVASIGAWHFYRAGYFNWRLFWPFAVLSIPLAFRGGSYQLPAHAFKLLVGTVLFFSAVRFLIRTHEDPEPTPPKIPIAIGVGGGLGLLAGLTGTGGGIFLTPLMIFMRWARTKTASAVSGLFILVNSISGLLGDFSATRTFPHVGLVLLAAAGTGGWLGSYLGSSRFPQAIIKRLLAVVLIIAGGKFIAEAVRHLAQS